MIPIRAIKVFMWNPAEKLSITEEQRVTLQAWVAAKTSPQRTVLRARICLLAAEGLPTRVIARSLKTSRPTVVQWRKRFEEHGPQGLAETIEELLLDPPRARTLGETGRRAVFERFSAEAMARAMEKAYAELAARGQ